MKTKKRSKILSLLLTLSMLVGMVPFSVIPASASDETAAEPFREIYIDVETASGTETRRMRNGSYLDGDYNLQYGVPSGGLLARYQDGVLTLSGCHCRKIYTPLSEKGHLTIDLIGENTIDARQTGINLRGGSGSSLTITSQWGGSLAISVLSDGYRGIDAGTTANIHYSLTIGGNAKIAINVRGDGQASGIVGNDISIIDQASVDITVGALTHAASNDGFINGILIANSSSGPCNFLLDTTGKVNIDVSDINADKGNSTGINATGSRDLRHVGEMTIRWATTDSRYGAPIAPQDTEFSQEHAINIDENNCYASYRAGKPYTVNVSYGTLTGKGVPYPKQSGNFLWYDTITLSANDYPVSDSDPTLVPFLRWETEQGTITDPTSKHGAKLDFLDVPTSQQIKVEAVHGAFSEVPVFVPTEEGKGTLFFKLFRGGGASLYLVKADTLEAVASNFSSSSDVTGEATRYNNFAEKFLPAGEYRMRLQCGTGIFYSQPFTIDYTTVPPQNINVSNSSGHFTIDQGQHARLFVIARCETAGVNYQWQYLNSEREWTNIPGATAYDYRVEGDEPGTTLYRCALFNKYGVVKYAGTGGVTVKENPTLNSTPAYILPAVNEPAPDPAVLWPEKVIDYYDLQDQILTKKAEFNVNAGDTFRANANYSHIPGGEGYKLEFYTGTQKGLYYKDFDSDEEETALLGQISYHWQVTQETDDWGLPTNYYTVGTGPVQDISIPHGVKTYWARLTITNTIGTGSNQKEKSSYVGITFHVSTPATDLTLNKDTLTLDVDETETLIATVEPHDTTDTVTWSSDNPAVATVDSNGLVTAKAPGTTRIIAKAGDFYGDICNVTVRGSGTSEASVSGSVVSYGEDDPVTVQLIKEGTSEPAYETIVSGGTQSGNKFTASYSFSDVPSGTYTMKVMKQNHVTREYTITVGAEAVTQDVKIHLKGDVNGDGNITNIDVNKTNLYFRSKTNLTDYELLCADVTGDGKITNLDVNRMNLHFRDKSKLW